MTEHPVPPSDKRPLLSWYPAVAGMARAGDLGYTTGPWEFKNDIHDAKPVAWGHFLTVWKKQADGSWKFAIDLGISNPQPAQAAAPWELPKNYKTPGRMKGIWSFSSDALLARDREFAKDCSGAWRRAQLSLRMRLPDVRALSRREVSPSRTRCWRPRFCLRVRVSGPGSRMFATCRVSDDLGLHLWHVYKSPVRG